VIQGNVDLKKLHDFHLNLNYELISDGRIGFNFADPTHETKYNLESIQVCVCRNLPENILSYIKKTFNMDGFSVSVQKMLPGMILPYHKDKYGFYLSQHTNIKINQVKRVIVFLEDWKAGHISEIAGESHTNWQQGDWISWTGTTPHLAANLGFDNRYTLQITGILK
jgi:hypothetical protein